MSVGMPHRVVCPSDIEVCANGCARQDHVLPSGIAAYAPAAPTATSVPSTDPKIPLARTA